MCGLHVNWIHQLLVLVELIYRITPEGISRSLLKHYLHIVSVDI
jgi:hypothetical protein